MTDLQVAIKREAVVTLDTSSKGQIEEGISSSIAKIVYIGMMYRLLKHQHVC